MSHVFTSSSWMRLMVVAWWSACHASRNNRFFSISTNRDWLGSENHKPARIEEQVGLNKKIVFERWIITWGRGAAVADAYRDMLTVIRTIARRPRLAASGATRLARATVETRLTCPNWSSDWPHP